MRHRVKNTRLNRSKSKLRALMRSIVTSLILYEKIETTRDKAKLAKSYVDRLISRAKTKEKMSAIRYIMRFVFDKQASMKVIDELALRYQDRDSGFTRSTNTRVRTGDNAQMVLFELI